MSGAVVPIGSRAIKPGGPGAAICDDKGRIVVCTDSAVALILGAHEWRGVIAFDELQQCTVVRGQIPGYETIVRQLWGPDKRSERWVDKHTRAAVCWLERMTGRKWSRDVVHDAVEIVATANSYDPVTSYLNSLTYVPTPDGDGAMSGPADDWTVRLLGAEDTPYNRLVGKMWLVSCVARAFEPGCKVDTTIVFEGKQGAGKSHALRALCHDPSWYSDTRLEIGSKDAMAQLEGIWIYEVAELDSFRGKAETQIKAFLTSQVDKYRPAYARSVHAFPRRCCFAGTTNEDRWLDDRTGGRRYWPVKTGAVDVRAIARERDEIWAHAVALYRDGFAWWAQAEPDRELLVSAQAERQSEDTWTDAIETWDRTDRPTTTSDDRTIYLPRDKITTEAVLSHACEVPLERQDARAVKRVSSLLRMLGWTHARARIDGARAYVWTPPPRPGDTAELF